MWLDLVAVALLLVCTALGAWRGSRATGFAIASLFLSYGAALLAGPVLGPAVGERLGLAAILAIPVSCAGVFLVSYVVLGLVARLAVRWRRTDNAVRSPRDRFLGASFGAMRGLLVAMLVVYLAMWLDALRATGNAPAMPEIGDSTAAAVTGGAVENAVGLAVDPAEPGSRFAVRFASRPAVAAVELQAVVDHPGFARLQGDSDFWGDVEGGDVEGALRRPSFRALQGDAQLRRTLADLGIVPEEAAVDGEVFRQTMGQVLTEIGPRLRDMRNDPAIRDLLQDPQIVAMVQSGNTLGLLSDPRFRELVARIGETDPGR